MGLQVHFSLPFPIYSIHGTFAIVFSKRFEGCAADSWFPFLQFTRDWLDSSHGQNSSLKLKHGDDELRRFFFDFVVYEYKALDDVRSLEFKINNWLWFLFWIFKLGIYHSFICLNTKNQMVCFVVYPIYFPLSLLYHWFAFSSWGCHGMLRSL